MATRSLLFLAPFLLAGCISIGGDFPSPTTATLEPGRTTMRQVQDAFGPPWRTGLEDGDRTWTYGEYRYALLGDGMARDLVLRFDAGGVLKHYTYNTTENEK